MGYKVHGRIATSADGNAGGRAVPYWSLCGSNSAVEGCTVVLLYEDVN